MAPGESWPGMTVPIAVCVFLLLLFLRGWARARDRHRLIQLVRGPGRGRAGPSATRRVRRPPRWVSRFVIPTATALLGASVGAWLMGPAGMVAGAVAGGLGPKILARRTGKRRVIVLESQLAETVDVVSGAVRGGSSLVQAFQLAAAEVSEPMAGLLRQVSVERELGVPFLSAVEHFAGSVGLDDARMFTLVIGIHARSGGDLSAGLEEVAATLRHRTRLRRELRALTAQGRISGVVLGALPILFSAVLAATSRRELRPVYASPVGIVLVTAGLILEALAYLSISRLLRVAG